MFVAPAAVAETAVPAPAASPSSGTPAAIDLGTLGGTSGSATAVNDRGQAVGFSTLAGEAATHAFSWTAKRGMVDLAPSAAVGASLSQ